MNITSELFGSYLKCRYKAHLEARGMVGQLSEYEQMSSQRLKQYQDQALPHVFQMHKPAAMTPPLMVSDAVLREKRRLIIDARLTSNGIEAACDALERMKGASPLGNFQDQLVLFRVGEKISREDKLMLGFAGLALAAVQGERVKSGKIICGKGYQAHSIRLGQEMAEAENVVEEIRTLLSSGQPPSIILNDHCRVCEYRQSCRAEAREKDHLSLLRGLSEQQIATLNRRGIFTVTQYSYTFRPRRIRSKQKPRRFDLQALAIREGKIHVLETPTLPTGAVNIYLDVEGDPERDLYYLIGVVIEQGSSVEQHSFWADSPHEQEAMVTRFLDLLGPYEDFRLFHYGAYEAKFLKKMKARLNGAYAAVLDKAIQRAVNVLALLYPDVYFPTYSNELKEIGRYLGCAWTDEQASGIQSLVWRYHWETTQDEQWKARLLRYNQEDCLALRRVVRFLAHLRSQGSDPAAGEPEYIHADSIKPSTFKKFGKIDFCLPEMELLNQCAYFNYERDRVALRKANGRAAQRRAKRRGSVLTGRMTRVVELARPSACPDCGCQKVYVNQHFSKRAADLRFRRQSVHRVTVEYRSKQGKCTRCSKTFNRQEFKATKRYGHGVLSWIVYFNVALNMPLNRILESLTDLFGFSFSRGRTQSFKRVAAEYYQETYQALVQKIRQSDVVHADETQVRIGREKHYVWVFTNTREVVFAYAESREGSVLREFLGDFHGVLISDFYAAYDAMDCPQQKCLVHLMRDMNDDLLANPFDQEFKELAQDFSTLLQAIVQTIDTHGLRKWYLRKHKAAVERFYDDVLSRTYQSEAVTKLQKRLEKNRDKLFTFLSYDGVSWHNNKAEHAIKHFAEYRRAQRGLFTSESLQQYLVLLSMFQTCKYRNIPFLQFLLSKDMDIAQHSRAGLHNSARAVKVALSSSLSAALPNQDR